MGFGNFKTASEVTVEFNLKTKRERLFYRNPSN
jgi:hypothetical protein